MIKSDSKLGLDRCLGLVRLCLKDWMIFNELQNEMEGFRGNVKHLNKVVMDIRAVGMLPS